MKEFSKILIDALLIILCIVIITISDEKFTIIIWSVACGVWIMCLTLDCMKVWFTDKYDKFFD